MTCLDNNNSIVFFNLTQPKQQDRSASRSVRRHSGPVSLARLDGETGAAGEFGRALGKQEEAGDSRSKLKNKLLSIGYGYDMCSRNPHSFHPLTEQGYNEQQPLVHTDATGFPNRVIKHQHKVTSSF